MTDLSILLIGVACVAVTWGFLVLCERVRR
jgi:hypothetical protein